MGARELIHWPKFVGKNWETIPSLVAFLSFEPAADIR